MRLSQLVGASALSTGFAVAQSPPKPQGTTVLDSRFHDGVQISYKEVWCFQLHE